MVTDIKSYPAGDPTTVSEIILVENGKDELITMDPSDIVIVTLGSISTGTQTGSNQEPPQAILAESVKDGEWSLWKKLSEQSLKFGNPLNFSTRIDETKIETFTTTFRESNFMKYYKELTKDKSVTGSLLSMIGSPWGLNISVPHQPISATQPDLVDVIWGYGLHPEKEGVFVKKPMEQCSGEEILYELLSYMKFPINELLPSAITIPCIVPLGTSMLLTRVLHDRPKIIPHRTTNIAFIGQYVEIPNDTTFSVEYSVRGAEIAVSKLMGLPEEPPRASRNTLLEVLRMIA
jgi:oleate hydratase